MISENDEINIEEKEGLILISEENIKLLKPKKIVKKLVLNTNLSESRG